MNLDNYPVLSDILTGYLIGCAVAAFLGIVLTIETYIFSWLFKGNILRKNLQKIQDPANTGFKVAAGIFAISILSNVLMSWLGAIQYLFLIVWTPLKILRETFSSAPEEIKAIRFPLINNPDLSKEAVFAYAYSLSTKMGHRADAWAIAAQIKEITDYHPTFNSAIALQTLGKLGAVDQEIVSLAADELEELTSGDT